MAPQIYLRWDEPYLFDALFFFLGGRVEYGQRVVNGQLFTYGFVEPTDLRVFTDASFEPLEDAALRWYSTRCPPSHVRESQKISDHDPAFSGRPFWEPL